MIMALVMSFFFHSGFRDGWGKELKTLLSLSSRNEKLCVCFFFFFPLLNSLSLKLWRNKISNVEFHTETCENLVTFSQHLIQEYS